MYKDIIGPEKNKTPEGRHDTLNSWFDIILVQKRVQRQT